MQTQKKSLGIINKCKESAYYLNILQSLHDVSQDHTLHWLGQKIREFQPEQKQSTFIKIASKQQENFIHDYQYIESMHNFQTWVALTEEHKKLAENGELAKKYSGLKLSNSENDNNVLNRQLEEILHECFNALLSRISGIILNKTQEVSLEDRQTYILIMLRKKTLELQNSMLYLYNYYKLQHKSLSAKLNQAYLAANALIDYAQLFQLLKSDILKPCLVKAIEQTTPIKKKLEQLHEVLSKGDENFPGLPKYEMARNPYEIYVSEKNRNLEKSDYLEHKITIKKTSQTIPIPIKKKIKKEDVNFLCNFSPIINVNDKTNSGSVPTGNWRSRFVSRVIAIDKSTDDDDILHGSRTNGSSY